MSEQFDPRVELYRCKARIEALLPKHIEFARFCAMAARAWYDDPAIRECTSASFIESVYKAAKFGLEIDGLLGEAYLVPFNTQENGKKVKCCQLIPGYKGYLKLAMQSGEVKSILPAIVYAADKFRFKLGSSPEVIHYPAAATEEQLADDQITHVYVVVFLKNGGSIPFVWPVEKIKRHRDKYSKAYKYANGSKGNKDSTWHLEFGPMSLKTVMRAAMSSGLIPLDCEVKAMVQVDKLTESGADEQKTSQIVEDMDGLVANLRQPKIEAKEEPRDFRREAESTEANRESVPAEQPKKEQARKHQSEETKDEPSRSDSSGASQRSESTVLDDFREQIHKCETVEDVQVVSIAIKRSQLDAEDKTYLTRLLDKKNQLVRYG